jgi:toxin ParE1/3/4
MTYRLTGVAKEDLEEIHDFITKGSSRHATQMLQRFESIFNLLVDAPMAGTSRNELEQGIRSYPVGSYIIFYHVKDQFVIIDRVLHTGRDIEFIFNPN